MFALAAFSVAIATALVLDAPHNWLAMLFALVSILFTIGEGEK